MITQTVAQFVYTRDALGGTRYTRETFGGREVLTPTRHITTTYDGLHRVIQTAYSTGEAFGYDLNALGLRTRMTATTPLSGTVVTTYTYDTNRQMDGRTVSDGRSYIYTWSRRGQMLAEWTSGIPVRAYTYDGAGRMVTATVFTQTTTFEYNGLGARVALSVSGETLRFVLDYAGAGGRATILAETTPTSRTLYIYGRQCLGEVRDGTPLYYLHDAAGSFAAGGYVRQGADAAGAITAAREWSPYGVELVLSGAEGAGGTQTGLGYTGEWQDTNVGLTYLRARWYDPGMGPFTSQDVCEGDCERPQSSYG